MIRNLFMTLAAVSMMYVSVPSFANSHQGVSNQSETMYAQRFRRRGGSRFYWNYSPGYGFSFGYGRPYYNRYYRNYYRYPYYRNYYRNYRYPYYYRGYYPYRRWYR